jgi:hypothetical protein
MAEVSDDHPAEVSAPPRRRFWPLALSGLALLLASVLATAWLTRERIVDNIIAGQIARLGLPASYEIERIGADAQVLRKVIIGDPARPDLTIERVTVAIKARWGVPDVGRITLEKPRLYGRLKDGRVSFGTLDPLIYTDSTAPFRLPDLDVAIRDGRGRITSDMGDIGIKLEGEGRLRDGYSGIVAAVLPQGTARGCTLTGASLYGELSVAKERPRFAGPLRLGELACPLDGLRLGQSTLAISATIDKALDGAEGTTNLAAGPFGLGTTTLAGAGGETRFVWRGQALTAQYDVEARQLSSGGVVLGELTAKGALRAQQNFARAETEGDLAARELRPGPGLANLLAALERSGAGSMAAPLAAQLRGALARELPGSRLSANYLLRSGDGTMSLVVPQGNLRGGSGQSLLALSRLSFSADGKSAPRLTANFTTGGRGLPQIAGRMERGAGGGIAMRLVMADYAAGAARLALPRLTLVQAESGALGFSGSVRLSGPLPGGAARNLEVPLEGGWSQSTGLAIGRKCTPLRFDSLAFADLTLSGRTVTLCPQPGGAIVRSGAGGLRIAAGAPSLDLAGKLGSTPIRIASGPVGFAVPGMLAARSLDIALGPASSPSHFRLANLNAQIGREVAGSFAGTQVLLAAVPLDLLDASGTWGFANGRLTIANGSFRLEDRELDDRFQPMSAREGTLTLEGNRIVADAVLREPRSDRALARTAIRHDLSSGTGSADLAVDGIVLDDKLQPDQVSRLALGVIANAQGTVRGTGRIDWNEARVTSTGSFTTDKFDFAAAFGPVQGLSGTVNFTDLLSLITAPGQRLKIAAINPGIEVNDGEMVFAIRPGNLLEIDGARWPFLDGVLTLEPTRMVLGGAETRRFTLRIDGLDAAKFVARVEMGNVNATGIFDGVLPLVFDENGGRIDGGMLASRPPGGNVSYVGALTYKDLSAMANFAFDALRSIDYRQMRIGMDGPLEGEIVTRVSFDGIRQGTTARRNFITNQIAKLPIKFNVNLRAPFFKLVSSFKSLYDPTYVLDPRTLGLMGADGKPLPAVPRPPALPPVQPPVSGTTP